MDFEYIYPIIVLFGSFAIMLAVGVPITFAIGLSSLFSILIALPPDAAISVISQKMTVGLDGFTLLAIPFFVLAGNIMNTGGIARRLVNLAQALVGRLPGSLAHCNILANTLFGAISGSAVASAAAVGGIMSPLQEKEGYSPAFSTAINVASAPIGLMIPPSNVLIVYSLASGGTSVAALFGRLPARHLNRAGFNDGSGAVCPSPPLPGCRTYQPAAVSVGIPRFIAQPVADIYYYRRHYRRRIYANRGLCDRGNL